MKVTGTPAALISRVYDSEHGIWEVYIAGVHYAGDTTYSRATMIDEVESRYDLTI